MKRIWIKIYAWALLILAVGGMVFVVFSATSNIDDLVDAVVGCTISIFLVPTVHELGHVVFALANRMEIVYCKFFAFHYYRKGEKKRFGFTNPLAPEETQVLPIGSENMQKRAYRYAIGGLVFSGLLFTIVLAASVLSWALGGSAFVAFSWLPYSAYLFLLNLLPVEYPSGKTDALIAAGIRKNESVEQTMVNLMRIHGELQQGKSFAEIDESFYFSAPQIAVDEPLYVAILEARYSYYLEKEEFEKALDCLKRIRAAGEYLSKDEIYTMERNLAFLCLIGGNDTVLKEAVKNDEKYWQRNEVPIKRILAMYMSGCGDEERTAALMGQAYSLLPSVFPAGLRKHEEIMLSRIK